MEFKTKDLLVTVLPKTDVAHKDLAKVCLLHTAICRNPTLYCAPVSYTCLRTNFTCNLFATFCGPCSVIKTCLCSAQGTWGCTAPHTQCLATPIGCFAVSPDPLTDTVRDPGNDPLVIRYQEDLVALRADLQLTLNALAAIQKEGLPSAIGDKETAETLERGLTEALEQVRAAKKAL